MTAKTKKAASLLTAAIVVSAAALGISVSALGGSRFIKSGGMESITREETGALLNENYYAYINFDRLRGETIPYGKSFVMLSDDWTETALIEKLHELAENRGKYARGTNEQKIADFYVQMFDEQARSAAGYSPLEGIISKIEQAGSINELVGIAAELQWDLGVPTLFSFRIGAGIYDSSEYSVAHTQMALPVEYGRFFTDYSLADGLQKSIRNIIELRGGENPHERAEKCVDMLLEIADNSIPENELFYATDSYIEITLDELAGRFTADISPYTDRIKGYGAKKITVCDTEQLAAQARLLTDENLSAWKDYMVTQTFAKYADFLPEEMMRLFNPFGVVYQRPKDENVISLLDKELAYIFAQEYADPDIIESAKGFTAEIISAYADMINSCTDIDDATKTRFIKKLENMHVNVDVPHEPYDGNYDCVPAEEGGGFLANIVSKCAGEFRKSLENLGKPFDKTVYDWNGMAPQTYGNAQYHTANYVTIPYASLTAPYYDKDGDLYKNLGYIGFIIGHEISHGFDSSCMKFDENGNFNPDWIGGEYSAVLEKKKADITELFNRYKLFGVYPLDGEKTLGENMADIASVQCMLSMAKTKEQKQTFMENYARGWYMMMYDTEAYDQLYNDEHSLNEFRTNVVLSQMDDFYDIYGITDGSMYTAPEDRRRVWQCG